MFPVEQLEHPDITHAIRTGYPRGVLTPPLPVFPEYDGQAFPYEEGDEEDGK